MTSIAKKLCQFSLAVSLFTLASPALSATFEVTNTSDIYTGNCSGSCSSLRDAIAAASRNNEDDTINLQPGTYTLTLAGSAEDNGETGDLDIFGGNAITINGGDSDPANTIIDASSLGDRVFHIISGTLSATTVTINNLTLANSTVDGENGGAIYNNTNNSLTINDVVIRESGTTNNGGLVGQGLGGAIFNDGTIVINNSLITGNTADVHQADQQAIYGGGGLYNSVSGDATITNSIFRRNTAFNDFSTIDDEPNFSSGGGILNVLGTLFIEDSVIGDENNEIIQEDYKNYDTSAGDDVANVSDAGAGISNIGGFVTINRSNISYNDTSEPPNFTNDDHGREGGGIYNSNAGESRGSMLITASTISFNSSQKQGGGIFNTGSPLTITHSTINDNHAFFLGGGIVNQSNQSVELSNSTIAYNEAGGTVHGVGNGGGIYAASRFNINSVTIAGNTADQGTQIFLVFDDDDPRNIPPRINIENSIIDHKTPANDQTNADINCQGSELDTVTDNMISTGFNLETGNSCNLTETSDQIDIDPLLRSALEENPSSNGVIPPTLTIGFDNATSPAISGGPSNATRCPSRDQRYFVRDTQCDIGAFEFGAAEGQQDIADLKVSLREASEPSVTGSEAFFYTATVTNIGPAESTGITLTFSIKNLSHQRTRFPAACTPTTGNTLTCSLGGLAAFETEDIEIALIPLEAGEMEAQASVTSSNTEDYFPGNNDVTETTEIMDANNCHTNIPGCSTFSNSSGGGGGGALYYLALLLLLMGIKPVFARSKACLR